MTKPVVQALLDKAEANLAAARLLVESNHLDSAASRAYYAMFYVAEGLLAERGLSYSKHAGVIAAFGREYAKAGTLDPKFHWADEFLDAARSYLAAR
ncbi:MAG: HEPN domain-containing protein [Gemmatimonadota bacterium]